jgi:hypothetical protein
MDLEILEKRLPLMVVGILLVNLASALVPGLDGALAALPIVVLMLVVGTVVILARSLRR